MGILRTGLRALGGAIVITLAAQAGVACGSSNGGGGSGGRGGSNSNGGSSGADAGGGSSGSSSSGCNNKVYSHQSQSLDCIESYAPQPPANFASGQCPTAGLNGCCVQNGPCGFTATCYYNLQAQLLAGAEKNCANEHGTWSATVP